MNRRSSSFNPSTNLVSDLDNKTLLKSIIVTKQIQNAIQTYSGDDVDSSAVSIVGPYGSGKSTTTLFLYHYLCASLPKDLQASLNKVGIKKFQDRYKPKDINVLVGKKDSLQKTLLKHFSIKSDLTSHIKEHYISKNKRLVVIIDEFGKFLEYANDNPSDGDVYILQELAELASRSKNLFKLIMVRHQSVLGYFSGLKGTYLNEWKKIQGRFYELVHSNTIEDTITLIKPYLDENSKSSNYTPTKEVLKYIRNNEAIGAVSQNNTFSNPYPFHPFSLLTIVSAYKQFAQNERSVFSFLNTNDRFGLNDFTSNNENIYSISEFYDYVKYNLEHLVIESVYYQEWNKIDVALRDLKKVQDGFIVKNHEFCKKLIKTIGLLDLFGSEIELNASKDILTASLIDITNKNISSLVKKCLSGLEKENIVLYNKYHGGAYHLWHGAQVNISELIDSTIVSQRDATDLAKHLDRLSPNDPIIAKKHFIETGTFRSIELRYANINEFPQDRQLTSDAVIYVFVAHNTYQRNQISSKILDLDLDEREKPMILMISKNLESHIRQYIAVHYLEQNNEQLKTDRIGREELSNIKYRSSLIIDGMIKNSSIGRSLFWLTGDSFKPSSYKEISTKYIDNWIYDIYKLTPNVKNELVNQNSPSPSAIVGVKKLFTQMLQFSHMPNFGIETSGPEKSIYLNVIHQTGIHQLIDGKYKLGDPVKDEKLLSLWAKWDELIRSSKDDNDRINLRAMISEAQKPPYGLKYGLAHILSIVKIFSDIDQISIYHKTFIGNEFRYIAQIATDTIDLLTKRPENFEIKFVDSKIHQTLFAELYHFLNQKQKDITTLLDVARSIIERVSNLRDRTVKTRKISSRAQRFIKDVRDARSPEDLIYKKIPESLGLDTITSRNKVSNKEYVNKLQEVLNEIHEFEQNLIPQIKQQIIATWELNLKNDVSISKVKSKISLEIRDDVLPWVFDEKLKEFIKRILDDKRNGGAWIESVSSHLVGKLPERWSDDDDVVLMDQLRFMRIQYLEALYFYEKNAASNKVKSKESSHIEEKIITLMENIDASDEQKRVAIINLYEKYVRTKEKN